MPTEKKITYLIGAGASYKALPIVSEIPEKLEEMVSFIEIYNKEKLGKIVHLNSLRKTTNEIAQHASIDTLARKYWLKYQDHTAPEYIWIKQIITCLLIYEQVDKITLNSKGHAHPTKETRKSYLLDPRYEAFFASILTEKFSLPNTISIVSWNYDFQIEKAFNFYYPSVSLMETGKAIGIDYYVAKSSSNLIKLNGTSFFVDGVDNEQIDYRTYNNELNTLFLKILRDKPQIGTGPYPGIKFAWEVNSDLATSNRERAEEKISSCDYVVVIGYSFPIFNREIDIELFKNFNGEKIYIQDTSERVNQIKNQLESIKSGLSQKCETQTNLDQFLIPNEYWTFPPNKGTYYMGVL